MANFLRSGLGNVLTGGLGGLIVGPKKPPPPPVMPDPNDPQSLAAKRQDFARQAALAGGRQSTIMTSPSGNYTASAMGG